MSYYVTKPGTKSAEKIEALFKEVKRCKKASAKFAKELGATSTVRSNYYVAGYIHAFRFASTRKGVYSIKAELQAKADGKVPDGLRFCRKVDAWVLALKTTEGKILKEKMRRLPKVLPGAVRNIFQTEETTDVAIGELKRISKFYPAKSFHGGFVFVQGLFSHGALPKDCKSIKKSRYYYFLGE